MTHDQVRALIDTINEPLTVDEFLVVLCTKAAAWEREQCAKVCDDVDNQDLIAGEAELCAMIIRARGEK
jgi:hypothetical protein